MGFNLALMS